MLHYRIARQLHAINDTGESIFVYKAQRKKLFFWVNLSLGPVYSKSYAIEAIKQAQQLDKAKADYPGTITCYSVKK